ncbi:MAG: Crp/Fnr family transcriptional regulator [Pseudomonadota bacterium]
MNSSDHPLDRFIADLCGRSPLEGSDIAALKALPFRMRRVDAGTYLVREGSVPDHCAVLVEGYAFRQKVTGDGSRQILAVCVPGDAVDLQNIFLNVSDHSVQMLNKGTIADLLREPLQELVMTRPRLARALIQQTLFEASILREWVVNVGQRDARERIAHILCEFAVRLESRGLAGKDGFELPMTQEQLADAAGLTSVHVNRVLKGLEKDGLINRRRRHIHYDNWRALQDAGDFTRGYLHIPGEDLVDQAFAV